MEVKNEKKQDKFYCCYSLPLRKYLYANGLEYDLAALNPNTKKLLKRNNANYRIITVDDMKNKSLCEIFDFLDINNK